MQPLSQTRPGDVYTIKWMLGAPEAVKAMRSLNIHEGSTIQVIRKFRDSLIIGFADRRVALGNEVAARIQV